MLVDIERALATLRTEIARKDRVIALHREVFLRLESQDIVSDEQTGRVSLLRAARFLLLASMLAGVRAC